MFLFYVSGVNLYGKKVLMEVRDLGRRGYEDSLHFQTALVYDRIERRAPDTLIMVEHDPVVTLGRQAKENSIIDRNFLREKGIPVVSSGRGGQITYHAPGQLVLYPVVALKGQRRDIASYIDFLEKVVEGSLRRFDVPAERISGKRGVWVTGRKIAFIGIAVKKWVTYHGVAVNINNDITPFSCMHPCGEKDIEVTSACLWHRRKLDMNKVKKVFAGQFLKDLEEYAV